jgi:hypothetical protein
MNSDRIKQARAKLRDVLHARPFDPHDRINGLCEVVELMLPAEEPECTCVEDTVTGVHKSDCPLYSGESGRAQAEPIAWSDIDLSLCHDNRDEYAKYVAELLGIPINDARTVIAVAALIGAREHHDKLIATSRALFGADYFFTWLKARRP